MRASYYRKLWMECAHERGGVAFPREERKPRWEPGWKETPPMLKVVEKQDAREAGEELLLLDEIAREGARRMLMEARRAEADDYVERYRGASDEHGRALGARNGRAQPRKLSLGAGTVELKAPRVDDRRRDEQGGRQRFTSHLLPPYMRRSPKVAEVCCPSCTCAGSPPATFAPPCRGCWAKMPPVCRRPTSHGSPPAGRKSTPPFASVTWRGANSFTSGWMACTFNI